MGISCVHELFEAQVVRTPHAVATIADGVAAPRTELSYLELNQRANRLAHRLRSLDIGPEQRVGVCLQRGADLLISLLAVLKSGGAYVPLDPDYPTDRLAHMLADSGARIVVTSDELAPWLGPYDGTVIDAGAPVDEPDDDPIPLAHPDNPAYVMYTSGSTGGPKGVVVPHAGVVNRILWGQGEFRMSADERLLQKTPFSFDVSVPELFWPLAVGATVVMARPGGHRDPAYLARVLDELRITTVHFVPSMLRAFLAEPLEPLPHLRRMLCSGEALATDLVSAVSATLGCPVYNLYGPTEASIEVTATRCHPDVPVTIGVAVANTVAHVLDENLGQVPDLAEGQLCIAGIQVTRGYHNRPRLTAERFVPNPYGAVPGERLYLTGDLVRRMPDGSIDYIGRIDQQVKIRGNRVELGEIETALAADPTVSAAAVTVHTGQTDTRLIAYLVPAGGRVDVPAVRERLAGLLPDYMIPAVWITLAALPLTASGKVDRKALPAPNMDRPELAEPYLAPRTKTEQWLADIWESVLEISPVGVRDPFLDLGGQSLAATRVCARARQTFDTDLSVDDLLTARTIEGLAAVLDGADGRSSPAPVRTTTAEAGGYQLSFAQQGVWLQEQMAPGGSDYNLFESYRLRGRLDVPALRGALADTIARHATLRTTFRERAGIPYQLIAEEIETPFTTRTVRPGEELPFVRHEARRPIPLDDGPLLRMTLLRLDDTHHVVLLVIHHIVADDWSMEVLWRDLCAFYRARTEGGPAPLPTLPVRYVDYAAWQRNTPLADHLSYWRRNLTGAPLVLDLPADFPRAERMSAAAAMIEFTIPAETTAAVANLSKSSGTTPFMTLLAAFTSTIAFAAERADFLVGTFAGNRTLMEVEDLVGLFVNTLALRMYCPADQTFADLLAHVRSTALAAYRHQQLQFDHLVSALRPPRDLSRNPVVQVGFQSLGARAARVDLPNVDSTELRSGQGGNPFDILVVLRDSNASLSGELHYRGDLFSPTTARSLTDTFARITDLVTTDPTRPVSAV